MRLKKITDKMRINFLASMYRGTMYIGVFAIDWTGRKKNMRAAIDAAMLADRKEKK